MTAGTEDLSVGRKRITQIFRYLDELNRRRNPVVRTVEEQHWMLHLSTLPPNIAVQLAVPLQSGQVFQSIDTKTSSGSVADTDAVLTVSRATTTEAPAPPGELKVWLRPGWDDPYRNVELFPSRNQQLDGETFIVSWESNENIVEAHRKWKVLRDAWAVNEQPARNARKLFEELYAVYGRLEREAERLELVLGDGLLSWQRADGTVHHPVLLQRLQLRFDPQKPEFIFQRTEHPVELYSALFRGMPDVDGRTIGKCRTELEEGQFDPLDANITGGFLRRLATQLSPRGNFAESEPPGRIGTDPIIRRDPVIFLRSRTLGYAAALEAILSDLRQQKDLPVSLLSVAGVESQATNTKSAEVFPTSSVAGDGGQILLSKPANQEQVEIARRLEAHGCVLVQGPPGTGKTHTIANLIGHLLAQGKSILVTSHTNKALRVLRQQVVPQLQPLCVSVLEGSEESRHQLEASVSAIVERLASTDVEALSRQAKQYTEERHNLLEQERSLVEELQRARFDEYRDVVVAGRSFAPSDAARRVASGTKKQDWIPAPIIPDTPLPLTTDELHSLYQTNIILSPQDESDINTPLPKTGDLITPNEFARLLQQRQELEKTDLTLSAELWQSSRSDVSPESIEAMLNRATQAVELMRQGTQWQNAAIQVGREGETQRKVWESLLLLISETEQEADAAQELLMRHGPVLATNIALEEQTRLLAEIVGHLEGGRQITWLVLLSHSDWKKLIAQVRVGDSEPTTLEQFRALYASAKLTMKRKELIAWWERMMVPLETVSVTSHDLLPEQLCRQYKTLIQEALNWYQVVWLPIERDFHRLGFDWPGLLGKVPLNFSPHGELIRLRDAVVQHLPQTLLSRANYRRARLLSAQLQTAVGKLDVFRETSASPSPIVVELRDALVRWDTATYQRGYECLMELHKKAPAFALRRQLLSRLGISAPTWAAALRERLAPHASGEVPGNAEEAWVWRQLNDELDRRNRTSLGLIQQQLSQITERLRQVTADLVDCLAWEAQVRRTTLAQRKALVGWLQTIRRIGKGTGLRVPKLQAEARKLMADAQTAVPVWIMPLARVVESFNPGTTHFDVVIIDEASQSDVMGLIAFYMGKQVVVVGDDQQVSPDAVGEKINEVEHLIAEHLIDVPNAILYDGQQSVYDLAAQSFGGTICLREHFRCVSDIIEFSNRLSYEGNIRPLRDESAVVVKPSVVEYRVDGSASYGKINEKEALHIASLVAAAIEQPEYNFPDIQTFGIISLVGEDQARRIETILRERLFPMDYTERRIMCGTPPQFQGDERDIMFLSVVDAPQSGPLALRQQPLFKKRFNVAASRARNQMWIVHSLNVESDLKPGDLRRRLIEHARDPRAFSEVLSSKETQTDSDFERQVLRRLMHEGYQVTPQWKVGYYRIDLVVEDNGKRLAIECDGDRYHTMENLAADMQRQAILERLGWRFVRIRGSEFYRNPEQAMIPVFGRLNQLDIMPLSQNENLPPPAQGSHAGELYERVVRRAASLRSVWEAKSEAVEDKAPGLFAFSNGLTHNLPDTTADLG